MKVYIMIQYLRNLKDQVRMAESLSSLNFFRVSAAILKCLHILTLQWHLVLL